MRQPRDIEDDDAWRLPGLYRSWELSQVLAPGANFRIEEAGHTREGTPLLAVFRVPVDGEGPGDDR